MKTETKNLYDEKYEIRLANKKDIPAIMEFIEVNWKHGHIMAVNRRFFEYEFLEEDGTVNFILAISRDKGTIEGLNGFLKASHDKEYLDIWGSIWKVRPGNMGFLGAEIIKRHMPLTGCRNDIGVGDNPKTAIPVLDRMLKRHTGKMNHYYMLADRNDFQIAQVAKVPNVEAKSSIANIIEFDNIADLHQQFDFAKYRNCVPYKDEWYVDHRFFKHPIYQYSVYGIELESKVDAIFVLRNQELQGRTAVRFVDYIGNQRWFAELGDFFRKLLKTENFEYVDFYCGGFLEKPILDAGFKLLDEGDKNIIPNYFGPFLQENIDIWFDSSCHETIVTKADADQDRPSYG